MPDTQTLHGTSTPEATTNLVTLGYATAQLTELSVAKLAALPAAIEAASEAVRQWCRRDFVLAARDERYDGDGSTSLMLDRFPVVSIEAIFVGDPDEEEQLDAASYRFKPRTGEVRRASLARSWGSFLGDFPEGFQNIRVLYTAGFASVPGPVMQATIQVAKAMLDQAVRDTTVDNERWGSDYSYNRSPMRLDYGLPQTAKDILAPYREYRV